MEFLETEDRPDLEIRSYDLVFLGEFPAGRRPAEPPGIAPGPSEWPIDRLIYAAAQHRNEGRPRSRRDGPYGRASTHCRALSTEAAVSLARCAGDGVEVATPQSVKFFDIEAVS